MCHAIPQLVLAIYVASSFTLAHGQAPPPDVEQIQRDAKLLFEDLQAHRIQMEERTVDDLTLQLQSEILTVWDRLLDQADQQKQKNQPKSQPQREQPQDAEKSPEQDPSQQQSTQPMGQQPMPENGQEPQSSGDAEGQAPGNESKEPADRASEEIRQREQSRLLELRQAERERLMKEVWGKLPPRIRQKLLNASDEKYLPAYEDRIREYFRRLSTTDRE
ncbi:hypothetical protein OAL44_00025 [Planctomycetaceae bacterium]|nr:hypothetical protein [Planctomycetaceae bacterium]